MFGLLRNERVKLFKHRCAPTEQVREHRSAANTGHQRHCYAQESGSRIMIWNYHDEDVDAPRAHRLSDHRPADPCTLRLSNISD